MIYIRYINITMLKKLKISNLIFDPGKIKSEDEFLAQEPVTHVRLKPFGHYTSQIGKKKPSKKLTKDRVSEKSLLLSDRLLNKNTK